MRQRCLNVKNAAYPRYGGRGIEICERWMDFVMFYADMGKRPSPEHSLERIDNSRGYSPDNCKWATEIEQQRNRRDNVLITFQGETKTIAEWAEQLGLSANALYMRMNRLGWTPERAMAQKFKARSVVFRGETTTLKALAARYGINYGTLINRVDAGNDLEVALTAPVESKFRGKSKKAQV